MRNRYLLIALLVGVPLGWMAGSLFADEDDLIVAVAKGVATGLLTGGIAVGFTAWRDRAWAKWAATVCARHADEGIVHHGPAKFGHSTGIEIGLVMIRAPHLANGVDGWLVLTKERLVFQPRSEPLHRKPFQISITDIAGARRGDSLIPNTIALRLHNQRTIEIRVQNRGEWLDRLATIPGITVVR